MFGDKFVKCGSEQCIYWVPESVKYCCGPCEDAWEATPRYEPHEHSSLCKRRSLGSYSPMEEAVDSKPT